MNRIRVVLVDDHATVRQALRLLVAGQPDMEVVGEAGDGRAAVQLIQEARPTVGVLDISMPEFNGLAAMRVLHGTSPDTAIVALTRFDDEAYVREVLAAGALGYVLKQSVSAELLAAIRAAARGTRYLDSTVRPRMSRAVPERQHLPASASILTAREADVLRRIAIGHSNREIASELSLSVKTVEAHRAHAMRKLGLTGRVDIVRFAALQGWLDEL